MFDDERRCFDFFCSGLFISASFPERTLAFLPRFGAKSSLAVYILHQLPLQITQRERVGWCRRGKVSVEWFVVYTRQQHGLAAVAVQGPSSGNQQKRKRCRGHSSTVTKYPPEMVPGRPQICRCLGQYHYFQGLHYIDFTTSS